MRAAWALLLAGVLASACTRSDDALVVFAAASLVDVAQAAADRQPGVPVRLSVGPTSLLSQQIEQGAPADVFLAAHPQWVQRLVALGHTHADPVALASGHMVIVRGQAHSPVHSVFDALRTVQRIALADPSHVPAGQYAEEALRAAGVWETLNGRVLPVADVRAALVAVQQGAADAAIVYASDALAADGINVVYRFEGSQAPDIRYVGVAVSDHPDAVAWVRQLESSEMKAVWRSHGFSPARP